MAVGAKGRDKAAMHRRAIEPHGARAAVAGVAAFLDPEPSQIAQKGAQALTGPRPRIMALSIHGETHGAPARLPANSPRIRRIFSAVEIINDCNSPRFPIL